jgi:hypothetical protein
VQGRGGYRGRHRGGIERERGVERVRLRLTTRRERKGGRERGGRDKGAEGER